MLASKKHKAIRSITEHVESISNMNSGFLVQSRLNAIASELRLYFGSENKISSNIEYERFLGDRVEAYGKEEAERMMAVQRSNVVNYLNIAIKQLEIMGLYKRPKSNVFDGFSNYKILTIGISLVATSFLAGWGFGEWLNSFDLRILEEKKTRVEASGKYGNEANKQEAKKEEKQD
ncbi:hypothetical protein [Parapedobacter soli]|uniref:hypothetical protein n=1 Tax=Parapedobacter soli TaxID=416955 RepID=UPI0021C80F50|nr:hypothetical protein [Parapedobacter soli]